LHHQKAKRCGSGGNPGQRRACHAEARAQMPDRVLVTTTGCRISFGA
jgi:hypothetical protein